jgi:uncharacterized protein YjbJ (UPF0337 family)
MKRSTKDKAKGKFHELRGKLKTKVGSATKSRRLQAQGIGEALAGKMQAKLGQVEAAIEQKAIRNAPAQPSRATSRS